MSQATGDREIMATIPVPEEPQTDIIDDQIDLGSVGSAVDIGKSINQLLPLDPELETAIQDSFTWSIPDFHTLAKQDKVNSPAFTIGDFEWSVLLFPTGNNSSSLALYIEPKPLDKAESEWSVCAQFSITISNPTNNKHILSNHSHHRFSPYETDWGFGSFIELSKLAPNAKDKLGFLYEGELNVTVHVRIIKDVTGVLWHNFFHYDSKKVTGFVGVRNQGATCYLNSLLQSYYSTKSFRKLVYQIPTENELPTDSVTLALQRLFYTLQTAVDPTDTLEITKSFGWDTGDAFIQHDVQEMNRILMDKLESKMKGTAVEGKLNDIFVGKMKSYIKCVNVDYESSRVEDFWDIQLNVKNLQGLKQGFENYIEIEMLEGENQYAAEGHGLQDAKKGVVFESFPDVLTLQLKRFEYDFVYDQMVKINDRYEFPETIDLAPYLDGATEPDVYELHGVLVHSGDISAGHYYAMIKPGTDDIWYRFDDDKVWRATKKEVFDANFGCEKLSDSRLRQLSRDEYQQYILDRQTSAYMLLYIRQSKQEQVLEDVDESVVPAHVSEAVDREQKELAIKKKELEEMQLYVKVNVFNNSSFVQYQGFDMGPTENPTVSPPSIYTAETQPLKIKLLKSTTVDDLILQVKEAFPLKQFRLWTMEYRQNMTLRVEAPLPDLHSESLEMLLEKLGHSKGSSLNLWCEEPALELHALAQSISNYPQEFAGKSSLEKLTVARKLNANAEFMSRDPNLVCMFLKYFDSASQTLLGVTHFVADRMHPLHEILPLMEIISGVSIENGELWEEVSPETIVKVKLNDSYVLCELGTGDIVTFQGSQALHAHCPNVKSFYSYLKHRIMIQVSCSTEDDEYVVQHKDSNTHDVWISKMAKYDEVASVVGKAVGVDPGHLRISAVFMGNRYKMNSNSKLIDYIPKTNANGFIPQFEYEVLSISLKELENLKHIQVLWLSNSYVHYQALEFSLPETMCVGDLVDKLQERVKFSDEEKNDILLWANFEHTFQEMYTREKLLGQINSNGLVILARILPQEAQVYRELGSDVVTKPRQFLTIVFQFFKEMKHSHGISFCFNIIEGEKLSETKARLHSRFGLGTKEFSKTRLGIYTQNGRLNYIENDEMVLFDSMSENDFLFLDHPDRMRTFTDKAISIK